MGCNDTYFYSICSLSATLFHYKNPAYWSSYTVFSTGALLDFAFESAQKVSIYFLLNFSDLSCDYINYMKN